VHEEGVRRQDAKIMGTVVLNTFAANGSHRRDYVRGAAEAFNLRGNTSRHYHMHATGGEADAAAVENDWEAIGEDLSNAFRTVSAK
jgi:hypothetical protein